MRAQPCNLLALTTAGRRTSYSRKLLQLVFGLLFHIGQLRLRRGGSCLHFTPRPHKRNLPTDGQLLRGIQEAKSPLSPVPRREMGWNRTGGSWIAKNGEADP